MVEYAAINFMDKMMKDIAAKAKTKKVLNLFIWLYSWLEFSQTHIILVIKFTIITCLFYRN